MNGIAEQESAYGELTTRNSGYIAPVTQDKIRTTRLLIAGCGMGSSVAICAARLGFEKFILLDGDTVSRSNLNRQFYTASDVDKYKVTALRDHILSINPYAEVESVATLLNKENARSYVEKADMIFDTIDFVDLEAILSLHMTAHALKKPIITAINVGFGALMWCFPKDCPTSLPHLLSPLIDSISHAGLEANFTNIYKAFIDKLSPHLDADVVAHIYTVIDTMAHGTPCPASQIAPGAFGVASLCTTAMCELLAGHGVISAPVMVVHSFKTHKTHFVDF
jgi:molybdopterin/thiamine biosynthesis adenylyltransferase